MSSFGKVAVLAGGRSTEKGASRNVGSAVLESLLRQGVDAHLYDPAHRPLTFLAEEGYSRVYTALVGAEGEDGTVQGALEVMRIPYTGCRVLASALSFNKVMTKLVWLSAGLPTAPFRTVSRQERASVSPEHLLAELGGAVIVKPVSEGSSNYTAKAVTPQEVVKALDAGLAAHDVMMVERFIPGRELTVAVLHGKVLPPLEILLSGGADSVYLNALKPGGERSQEGVGFRCPAHLSPEEDRLIRNTALAATRVLGAEGVLRVDFRLDPEGRFYLLELNTCPGCSKGSCLPLILNAAAVSFDSVTMETLSSARFGK